MFVHSSIDGQNWGLKDYTAAGSRVPNNAAVVENLVTAGVISLLSLLVLQLTRIVLGKTNMSVMSNGYGAPGQPTGWSPLGGQTKSDMERIWLSMAAQQAVLWHYPLGSVQPLWAARLMAAL